MIWFVVLSVIAGLLTMYFASRFHIGLGGCNCKDAPQMVKM